MKKFTLGLLTGLLISVSLTAFANSEFILHKNTFPIFINGKEYKDKELPILNYDGSTYVPLRKTGDMLGTKVDFDDEKRVIEIGEQVSQINDINYYVETYDNFISLNTSKDITYIDNDDYCINFKNKKYIRIDCTEKYLPENHNYKFSHGSNNGLAIIKSGSYNTPNKIIIDDIFYISYISNTGITTYIEYDYFIYKILPILKQNN